MKLRGPASTDRRIAASQFLYSRKQTSRFGEMFDAASRPLARAWLSVGEGRFPRQRVRALIGREAAMSVIGGRSDNKCLIRAFPLLTQSGHFGAKSLTPFSSTDPFQSPRGHGMISWHLWPAIWSGPDSAVEAGLCDVISSHQFPTTLIRGSVPSLPPQ